MFNVAGIFNANPAGGPLGTAMTGTLVIGGTTGVSTMTAGTPLHPSNVRLVSGVNALGSILGFSIPCPNPPCTLGNFNPGLNNMATSSVGFPWTTGMITMMAPLAAGAPETFTITGMDNRGANGAGTIQLVAGSISDRVKSGPNANRGWIRLTMRTLPIATPAVPPSALVAGAGLMLLAAGYAVRRFKA